MDIAIVYSFKESEWFSCTLIIQNLLTAYTEEFGKNNILFINYDREGNLDHNDLKLIQENKIKKIIFIDHKPTPAHFLISLQKIDGGRLQSNREYIIHIFGDFPLYLHEWKHVFLSLENQKVKLICASNQQRNYLSHFLEVDDNLHVCPFPVNPAKFSHNPNKRLENRKKYNIQPDDYLFLYTGRISKQKRIVELIECFFEALKTNQITRKSKLMIVGPFDYLGMLYLDQVEEYGEYFRDIDFLLNTNPEWSENIVLVGKVKHEELNDLYNMADTYISLSTYHDEDYGMSVAEAICTGLPAILTGWGGYGSFKNDKNKDGISLIPVKLGRTKPSFDKNLVLKALSQFENLEYSREDFANLNQEFLSIKKVQSNLSDILSAQAKELSKPSQNMIFLANENEVNKTGLFRSHKELTFNDFYFEMYEAYVR